jgi:uncharacterized protein YdaU (DUF1376 family)
MPAELTRFDFHVHKFLNSEDVEIMTADEVGQYILLLCHSFVKGKEASLPNDLAVLAKYARVDKLSKLVLKKFPIVETEWGPRRRNQVMYAEYLSAVKRSLNGRSAVAERWEKDGNTDVIRPYNERSSLLLPNPIIPNQSIQSNQPTPISGGSGNWKVLAIRFREVLGKFISSTKTNKQKYAEFCSQYEQDRVIEIFNEWATQNKSWLAEKNDALFFFWKELPNLIEAVVSEKEKQTSEVPEFDIETAIEQGRAERQKEIAEDLKRALEQKEFEEAHKDEI